MSRSACRSGHVLSQDDGGEAVLLDLAGERYFGLNTVGTRVWQLLEHRISLQEVHRVLCAEFDAPPERIERDLLALAEQLHAAGLITLE
ncbi:MAG: PqqD family protein [Pseudomonadota bacterium]